MKRNNIKIAVTGGIGSGKSLACSCIRELGYVTYSCDEIYAELLQGKELCSTLAREFGSDVIAQDGSLNREKLSSIVFEDELKLKKLNAITHKAIFNEMFRRAELNNGLVFFEVPLLFEGGYQALFDGVIVILRSETDRIESVMERDKITAAQVKKRINSQFDYVNKDFAEYYVIHNNGDLCQFKQNVAITLKKISEEHII